MWCGVCSPLEVVGAALGHSIVDDTHVVDQLLLDLLAAVNVKLGQEVVRYRDQRVLRPALEPVHGTAGDKTGELECTATELLSDLSCDAHTQW